IDVPNYLLSAFSSLKYQQSLPQNRGLSQAVFFAKNKKALETKAPEIINKLNPEGLLWIAYPKKSGAIQSDLIRDDGWQIMYNSEWEGVASISVDDDWSAIRFRHKSVTKSLKRLPPIEERKTEGIDYINRTVTLPEEAVKMMK